MERSGLDSGEKGNLKDYICVNIKDQDNVNIKLTQPHIIDIIINDVQIPKNTAPQQIPALFTSILRRNATAPLFGERFNCRSVVKKLNFLEKITNPDIAYATHQYDRFSQDPRTSHRYAIVHLVKYLKATMTQGITLDSEDNKSF